ncbi:MAG: Hemin receptor [Paracidovorax wautersii]|uniref:Hemin receptor n=1 Tax=Paracidovorax wautersii TaxID=1177982 RepID=A0A7V8FL32_9BURK|nr:MAG: Hemin receptor [Paracidovorax wautersii]
MAAWATAPRGAPCTAARDYDLPAGPLGEALGRFAAEAGALLSADASLTHAKTAPTLKGRYTVEGGFAALLGTSGLQAVRDGSGVFLLRPAPAGRPVAEQHLAAVTVTAQHDAREAVFDTPGSVAVVTREKIDNLPPRNTGDVLDGVAGVFVTQDRSNPGVAVNIRGLQDFGRVNVTIDGARQNYQQSGHGANGHVYLDPELLSGVDIAKGPTSTVGGAGVIGGVVNFRTLEIGDIVKPDARSGGRINLSSGTNAYHFAGSAAAGSRVGDSVDVVAAVSRKHIGEFERGQRKQDGPLAVTEGLAMLTGQDQWSGLFKSTWQLAPGHRLRLGYIGFDAQFEENTEGEATSKVRSDTLQAQYDWKPGSDWIDLASSLYYTRTRNRQFRETSASNDYGAFDIRYQTSTVGGTLSNTARFGRPGLSVEWRHGGEFFYDWTDPQAQSTGTGEAQWFTGPTPEGSRTVASAFSELAVAHENGLEAIAGLRYDWFQLEGDGQMYIGQRANPQGTRPPYTRLYTDFGVRRHAGAFAPKLTLAWRAVDPLQFFASYGRGLRPPAITETLLAGAHVGNTFPYLPNPSLKEERSRTWEVGANIKFDGLLLPHDKLRGKVAWFDSRVDNYITQARVLRPNQAGTGNNFAYVNLTAPTTIQGFEAQLEYDTGRVFGELSFTRLHMAYGAVSYDPYVLGSLLGYPPTTLGSSGDSLTLSRLPGRKFTLTSGLRLLDRKLTLGGRVRYHKNDEISLGSSYGKSVTNWTVYDAWLAWQPHTDVTLRLAINNLFDRSYGEETSSGYSIAPGRTAIASVSYRF